MPGSESPQKSSGQRVQGTLRSAMSAAYNASQKGGRQLRWAHIIHGIKGIRHGYRSLDGLKRLHGCCVKRAVCSQITHGTQPNEPMLEAPLFQLRPECGEDRKEFLTDWSSLFRFLERRTVEPTTESPEKGLRPTVVRRKSRCGNQSDHRELLTARLLPLERSSIFQIALRQSSERSRTVS